MLYEDGIVTPLLIQTKKVESIIIDEKQLFPETINKELEEKIDEINPENKIITIRIRGVLEEGKTTDILINKQIDRLYRKGAYFVLKNISGLRTKDFISTKITKDTIEEIEAQIIEEDAGQVMLKTIELDKELIKKLIKFLAEEKLEGEKNAEYEIRVLENVQKELNID